MAMSRGRRLSKRQKRRSLKRNNVKSRKVMRGGGPKCMSGWKRAQQEGTTAQEKWLKANGIQNWSPTMCDGKP